MATTKLKTSVVAAVIVASVLTPLLIQRQAQARLAEQDKQGRAQSEQLARLTSDNQRLAASLAKAESTQSSSDRQFREVLRLRGEVGRLKNIIRETQSAKATTPASPEDQIASLAKMYAARVDRLKQWLEANPGEKIPEFKHLTDGDWLNGIESLGDDATDEDYKSALRIMRANAEGVVLGKLFQALRGYSKDNGGQFPTDLSQLEPYLATPIDQAILQRYEIVPTKSLVSELQPAGDWVITQTAPINADLDLRSAYSLTDMRTADERVSNRWTYVSIP
jgi:type II secretory pathway pseudopilin PulG